jgi:transposase-like protein
MDQANPFKWRHYQAEVILLCVRWYLRYSLSYRDLEEMMHERSLRIDHTTIYRWVQAYAPELEQRVKAHLKQTNDSWRVDETYVKVKGTWMYLYRAVDSAGNTLDFMLSEKRNARAAHRFFSKMLGGHHTVLPRVITVDHNAAYPKAMRRIRRRRNFPTGCTLRQSTYLNNIVEQDHHFIKRRINPGMGFGSFETASRTIAGYEVMHMLRKGQVRDVGKGDIRGQDRFIEQLFRTAA